jgi:hypothetical protein
MRKIEKSDLEGKTIKSVDNRAINCVTLTFTDNSVLELTAEQAIATNAGFIPGIFVTSDK